MGFKFRDQQTLTYGGICLINHVLADMDHMDFQIVFFSPADTPLAFDFILLFCINVHLLCFNDQSSVKEFVSSYCIWVPWLLSHKLGFAKEYI